jgi:uncharacterized protein YcgI (DUF1989 family)
MSRRLTPAYQDSGTGALHVDEDLYSRIARAPRTLVDAFEVAPRTGRAWEVPAGHVWRIVEVDGPQVGDLNLWHRHNPRERFWAARTRQLQRAHVTTFDRLWSTLPHLRPMTTIIEDSMGGYGVDADGARVHDLLGSRCDPYVTRLLNGTDYDHHCHSNLVRAIMPYGLTELDVHDVLNVFQVTTLNDHDQYVMKPCPAQRGDHLDFFAEIDLLCALSACPGGDLSIPLWGPDAGDTTALGRPLGVEVYRLDDESVLAGWRAPRSPDYRGLHGMRAPEVG